MKARKRLIVFCLSSFLHSFRFGDVIYREVFEKVFKHRPLNSTRMQCAFRTLAKVFFRNQLIIFNDTQQQTNKPYNNVRIATTARTSLL